MLTSSVIIRYIYFAPLCDRAHFKFTLSCRVRFVIMTCTSACIQAVMPDYAKKISTTKAAWLAVEYIVDIMPEWEVNSRKEIQCVFHLL